MTVSQKSKQDNSLGKGNIRVELSKKLGKKHERLRQYLFLMFSDLDDLLRGTMYRYMNSSTKIPYLVLFW
jgi:hypothetical protein